MKKNKKFISLLVAVIFCMCISTTASAAEVFSSEDTKEDQFYVTVLDENGEYSDIAISNNGITEIPIYTYAVDENGYSSRLLATVATLRAYTGTTIFGEYRLYFEFTPVDLATSLLTVGFTGTLTTFHGADVQWGFNAFLAAMSGSCGAASHGVGTLSGGYVVLGYETAEILQVYVT